MFSTMPANALAGTYSSLLKQLDAGIMQVAFLSPETDVPAAQADRLVIRLGPAARHLGAAVISLAAGTDHAACARRIAPALDCLATTLAVTQDIARLDDLKLLRLAGELDLDFRDDSRLDRAISAVARRLGADLAWLSAPRSQLTVAARGHDHELDPGIRLELARLPARILPLAGKLRRPMIVAGPAHRDQAVHCHLLIVPLFVGRARHNAWLVLANALSSPPFRGWHVLTALTMGQALGRRLEVDLDRRTGLFNLGGLQAALPRLKALRGSLLMLDIDRLESVNQLHGMAAGDAAIMSLARLLSPPLLPPGALVARTSGDQFALLLPDTDADAAATLANRIQSAARSIQPGLPDDPAPMTLSGGVVEIADLRNAFDRHALDAQTALKLAKDHGRSRIEVFVPGSSTLIRRNDELIAAADLREALRTGQLLLFAQPIRQLADRAAPPGFELLIRLRDENGDIRSPGDFLAAAQRYQILQDLDRYVIDAALETLSRHRGLLARLTSAFSLNVSTQSLSSDAFVDHLIERIRASRVPAGLITLEITEQAALASVEHAAASIRRLRELGCGIAIDDFGTGANSLAYLRTLPVTRIKIDGSFVRDMLTNRRSEAGIRGIIQLAREYDLDTVSEYVETEQQAQRLQSLGIVRGQGYLFGKPEPLQSALDRLGEEERAGIREIFEQL